MIIATKLSILIHLNLFQLQGCDCEMWFKKLQISDNNQIVTRMYDKPPVVSGIRAGTSVQDSVGPYENVFMNLVINDNDKIVCSKILKGDSTLLPKMEKYLSKQTVSSAEKYTPYIFLDYSLLKFQRIKEGNINYRQISGRPSLNFSTVAGLFTDSLFNL